MAKRRTFKEQRKLNKESVRHFMVASKALKAVLTGHRMSHDKWASDVELANECMQMAFLKDDKVFEVANNLLRKYNALRKKVNKDE